MRIVNLLSRAVAALATAAFALMFLMFIVGVAMRYLFASPLSWSDETAIILLLWSMFLATAFVLKESEHVSLDLLYAALPPTGKRFAAFLAAAGCGLLFLAVAPGTYDLITFLWRERTPGLRLRLDMVYFCFVIFVVVVGLRLVWKAAQLLRRDWREHL